MKTLFKLLLLFGLIVYLVLAFTDFTRRVDTSVCEGLDIAVADSNHAGFITSAEVERILKQDKLDPRGKTMAFVNCKQIEAALLKNPFIKEVVCYKTAGNHISLILTQRRPLLRIVPRDGEDYYIDERGYVMAPHGYVADLAVATGNIDKKFAGKQLAELGRFLQGDAFWNDQVEQINVDDEQKIDIVPRVGDQVIHLGSADSIPKKFRNLMAFYEKVMPEVGWNKYERIDIGNPSQIVCLKRGKKS